MSNPSDDEFTLVGLQPLDLDPDAVTAYEVAVDLLNEVIGIYSGRLRDARSDPDAVAALSTAQAGYIATRNALRPDDPERVAQVRQECAEIIKHDRR